jgi:tRNA modification GTPase
LENSTRFDRLTHEPTVVLVGKPNAGKSTLLNALAGRERAVTSPTAGTTRDVLSVEIALHRGMIKLLDAAGLAETHSRAATDIERQMHDKALLAVESSDVIVLVHDATDHCGELPLPRAADVVVRTKSDLRHHPPHLNVSAKTGENLDQFRETLDRLAFGETLAAGPASLALNARHVRTVSEAREALARAKENANSGEGSEIVALDLRESVDTLGGVVGMVTPDELLGRIFSAFCIGK